MNQIKSTQLFIYVENIRSSDLQVFFFKEGTKLKRPFKITPAFPLRPTLYLTH